MLKEALYFSATDYKCLGTKIYLSGPISGLPEKNIKAFERAATFLRKKGYQVINPHEICSHLTTQSAWVEYMRVCIKDMMDADMVVLLPGWERSRGARIEMTLASMLDLPIRFYEEGRDPCCL